MTFEARLAFVLFFFALWLFFGLLIWAAVAVLRRGRGAMLALPLALAGAAAAGVLVPVLGWQDAGGFVFSVCTACVGAALGAFAGVALSDRMGFSQAPPDDALRPERESEGARR
jgi:hypothetical protein